MGVSLARRNLRFGSFDSTNGLWRANGDETTAIALQSMRRAGNTHAAGSPVKQLAAWANAAPDLLKSMQARVKKLLASD